MIIAATSHKSIDNVKIVYLAVGTKMSDVCSNCGNFKLYVSANLCVATCPLSTYPYEGYLLGGQACMTCSSKLN